MSKKQWTKRKDGGIQDPSNISDEKLMEAIGFTPHKGQEQVLDNMKRHNVICAGVRWGKSLLCGYIAFKHLLCDDQKIWIVSLSYDMARKVFDYVLDFMGEYDRNLVKSARILKKPTPIIEIEEWNSKIECKSAENETSLLGEELDLAILDEAARMKRDIWDRYLTARLSSRKGKSFIISTPFGKNWFYEEFNSAKDGEDSMAFQFETRENPHFDDKEWDRLKTKLSEDTFNQEYKATFLENEAYLFNNVNNCIREKDLVLEDSMKGHQYLMGVDLGRKHSFTAITVVDKETNSVVHLDRFKGNNWSMQKKRISQTAKRYNNARIVMDSSGIGDPIYDDLREEGLNIETFQFTGKSKYHLIENLKVAIENENLIIPNDDELVKELKAMREYKTGNRRGSGYTYDTPSNVNDDMIDSLALAVWRLDTKRKGAKSDIQRELSSYRKKTTKQSLTSGLI